jgi:hypothetical protein
MLVTGGLLVSIALLTLAAVAPVFRGNNPPRWTTRRWIGELVTLTIVCALAVGLTCLGAGAINAAQSGLDLLDLGLFAAVLLVTVVIFRSLKARARLGAARSDGFAAPASTRDPAPPRRAA